MWLGVRCLVKVTKNMCPQTFGKGVMELVNRNMSTHYHQTLSPILHVIWTLWSKVNTYFEKIVSSQFSANLIWEYIAFIGAQVNVWF